MAEVLNQAEVEALLASIEPIPGTPKAPRGRSSRNIAVYDFKRPERVSKEQMRALEGLHDGFGREFGAGLSGMLRSIVEVKLVSVDQLTYSEFVFSLENPTCFNLLQSGGLDGHIILDVNPSIIFPIVDRLLGGGRSNSQGHPTRPLTEIELKLAARMTDFAMRALENAWANLCQLDLSVDQVESNPQLIQIVPPNEVIVLISFELSLGDSRGIMNLCIPFNTIEPLAGKLSADTWSNYSRRVVDRGQQLRLEAGVQRSSVDVTVRLAETQLTAGDLATLAVGDILLTEHPAERGVTVVVQGTPLFRGQPGVVRGHKAIRFDTEIESIADSIRRELGEGVAPTETSDLPAI